MSIRLIALIGMLIAQFAGGGRLSGVNLAVTITVPTSNPTFNGGTATSMTVSGTAASDRTVTGCTWTNSLGGSGAATGTTSWTISALPLTIGANVITVTCLNLEGTSTAKVLTITTVPFSPTLTSLTPNTGPVATSVVIAGTHFGATQSASTVAFNGVSATPTSWSDTSIAVPVPATATTGGVIVTVNALASNSLTFTVSSSAPVLTSLVPSTGLVAAAITVNGSNFGATQGTSTIRFNGTLATPTSWSASVINVPVPAGATTGNVIVTVGGQASNPLGFTVLQPPTLTNLNPSSGPVGTSVTITGTNFGPTQGPSTLTFNGVTATPTSWTQTQIVAPVPLATPVGAGPVVVTVNGLTSNALTFTVTTPPVLVSLTPNTGPFPTTVTIAGSNFGATQGASTVRFNGTTATATAWSDTSITTSLPSGATTGNVIVTVGGLASNGLTYTVVLPVLATLTPNTGPFGTSVVIAGSNFGATQGASTVRFNGVLATATAWADTSITTSLPAGATTGNVTVTRGGVASNGLTFTVILPVITSLTPNNGAVGASVVIAGTNFGATQGASTVTFNGTTATVTSWSGTSLTTTVPTGATTGNVVVTVGGLSSNGVTFTVTGGTGLPTPCSDGATAGLATYVRQGATGSASGADWTNAITAMPSTLVRGRTYCVADTTTGFGAWTVSTHAASGTTYTKVVKATIADHGTSTGWSDTFGDGQAVWSSSGNTFTYGTSTGYLEINGNGSTTTCGSIASLKSGFSANNVASQMASQTGCGFKFISTAQGTNVVSWSSGGDHSIMRYVEIQGQSGTSTGNTSLGPGESFGLAGGGFSNGLFSYGYIHNSSTQVDTLGDNSTIEHTYITNSRNISAAGHDNIMFIGGGTNGVTWRYNHSVNYDSEGMFSTYFAAGASNNIFIYGNVFSSPLGNNPRGIEIRQNDSGSALHNTNILMYNNTFVDLSLAGIYDRTDEVNAGNTSCVGCIARNNISVNAANNFNDSDLVQNNNTDDSTTSRFVSYSGGNYHLTAPLAGASLPAPYDVDIFGNTRGADGTWDRGAFEFCSGGCSVP